VLVNMASGYGNDGGGFGDPVDRRRRSTLLGMRLMRGLIVDLMVVGELMSSVRMVVWIHRIRLVDGATISHSSSEKVTRGLTCSS
jgi:hypothetical protein